MLRKIFMAGLLSLSLTLVASAQSDPAPTGMIVAGQCALLDIRGIWRLPPEGDAVVVAEWGAQPQWLEDNTVTYLTFAGEFWTPAEHNFATGQRSIPWPGVEFLQEPYQLALSPDKTALAFVASDGRIDNPQDVLAIVDQRGHDGITLGPVDAANPILWSQESDQIAYVSSEDGQVHLQDYQAGENRVLSREPGEIKDIDWSADGTQIALATRDGNASEVVAMDIETGKATLLYESELTLTDIAWSPDGTQIAIVALNDRGEYKTDIVILNLTDETTLLVPKEADSQVTSLRWSPGGTYLAFIEWGSMGVALTAFDHETNEKVVLTSADFMAEGFAWPPNVDEIVLPDTVLDPCEDA